MSRARSTVLVAMAAIALLFQTSSASAKKLSQAKEKSWTSLAREVGESEENRDRAIAELRRRSTLISDLRSALHSKRERPLALEVISALKLKILLPELIALVPEDEDGFTILAVNTMMTDEMAPSVLKSYVAVIEGKKGARPTTAATVAMLEPMGRLNARMPRSLLVRLAHDPSPEIRSEILYYLRIMALRNGYTENVDLVTAMTSASEVQVRLQAISISAEILNHERGFHLASLKSYDGLNSLCLKEPGTTLKESCLAFLAERVAGRR